MMHVLFTARGSSSIVGFRLLTDRATLLSGKLITMRHKAAHVGWDGDFILVSTEQMGTSLYRNRAKYTNSQEGKIGVRGRWRGKRNRGVREREREGGLREGRRPYLSGWKTAYSEPQASSSLWLAVGDTQTEWPLGTV